MNFFSLISVELKKIKRSKILLILLVHGLRRKKKKRPLRMSPSLRGRSRRRR